ncbi:calcium/sodium antiporter [Alloalcanivorax dieselolei]|nr:calcium/sodium antiporter [Alloalcanivorax dieselolei]
MAFNVWGSRAPMLPALLTSVIALMVLSWSSDRFVTGAAGLSLKLGLSPALVGLTLVAFGTSAPEILVSATAALSDSSALAVANALGSNIANMGLVLALTLLWRPVPCPQDSRHQVLSVCLLVTALAGVVLIDGRLTRVDGVLLLAGLTVLAVATWKRKALMEAPPRDNPEGGRGRDLLLFLGGLVLLLISARALVWGATEVARQLGVGEALIGLTLVALGTSLPELATCLAATRRGHGELALGNVLGSNILNLLMVLPMPALLGPGRLADPALLDRDYTAVVLLTLVMALGMMLAVRRPLGRGTGLALLAGYGVYLMVLWRGLQATSGV